jgi:H+/gluconate symporter-like permease
MAPADPALPSIILAVVVLAIAGLLAAWQWADHQKRSDEHAEAEADYFARQDVRRFLGAFLMALVAIGIIVGSRIDHRVAAGQHRLFASVWIVVLLLLVVLLILAGSDWLATIGYARRQRKAIADERRALFGSERSHPAVPHNGEAGPDNGESNGPPSH